MDNSRTSNSAPAMTLCLIEINSHTLKFNLVSEQKILILAIFSIFVKYCLDIESR